MTLTKIVITSVALAGSALGLACSGGSAHNPQQVWFQRGDQFGSQAAAHGYYEPGAAPVDECVTLQLAINASPWSSTYRMPDGTSVVYHAPLATQNGPSNAWMRGCAAGISGR